MLSVITTSTLCVVRLAFCGRLSASTLGSGVGNAWATHDSGRQVALVAGARRVSSGIEHKWALGHCLVRTPSRLVVLGTGRQEDDPRQVHSRWEVAMVGHHCFGSLVLEVVGRHPAHLEGQHGRVLARLRPCGRRPPPSFELSILCESP